MDFEKGWKLFSITYSNVRTELSLIAEKLNTHREPYDDILRSENETVTDNDTKHSLDTMCNFYNALHEEALQRMRELMGQLKLTVNEEKTRISKFPEGEFDFLGYTFGTAWLYFCPFHGVTPIEVSF